MREMLPATVVDVFARWGGAASCRDLLAAGASDNDLERWARNGLVVRVGRGRYVVPTDPPPADPYQRARVEHLDRLAPLLALAPDAVAGLRTAAIVHDLPVIAVPPRPEIVRHTDRARLSGARTVRTPVIELHRDQVGPYWVTSLPRTAIDVALDLPPQQALMTVDAVLARGVPGPELVDILAARGPVRGCRDARRCLDWADGRSASALESYSRAVLLRWGLPRPRCNVWLRANGTTFCVDLLWDELGIVGEADGRIKYEDPAIVTPTTLWDEKRRQEWLEDLGFLVIRWTADRIFQQPDDIVGRWHRCRARRHTEPWRWPAELMSWQGPLPPRMEPARQIDG